MNSRKPEFETLFENRRRVLKAVGGSALAVSLAGLGACSGGDSGSAPSPAASTPPPANEPAGNEPEPAADASAPANATSEPVPEAEAPADSGQMTRLQESDPQAQGLGYVNDAGGIDPSAQPRYEAGQACANCALFMGGDEQEWGPCSIFPGRLVNRAGWCTVYSPKPGA